jgi:hypothetical protein
MTGSMLRRIVKGAAQRLGWEIRRLPPPSTQSAPPPTKGPLAEVVAKVLCANSATIRDVGARWAVDAGQAGWYRVPPLGRLIGFEPDLGECARLNAAARPGQRFVPVALGATTGPRTLHLIRDPACASLYPPAKATLDRLAGGSVMQKTGEGQTRLSG